MGGGFLRKKFEKKILYYRRLMANLRGWSDLAFGMSSGASAVYGWIRLAELVPTNEFSRPHLLWHAGIFKKTLKISILDQFGAATPQNYIYIYIYPGRGSAA